jgi:uncharacterized protein (DUF302 family)
MDASGMKDRLEIGYGFGRSFALPFADAVLRAREALKAEGFGVLCEIDLGEKLKEKLGVEFPKYLILGACNPPMAHQALQQEINLGLLLPCNVVVYEKDGRTIVAAIDADRMMSVVGNPGLSNVAAQVNAKLRKVIESL